MLTFEWIIVLLLGAVLLSALARRLKVPYPTFLAIGGMLLAFAPGSPSWTLEPELALALKSGNFGGLANEPKPIGGIALIAVSSW